AGAVALAAFIVLTVGFVVGLDLLLGQPWGAFIVGALYALGAFLVARMAGKALRQGGQEAQRHLQDARAEVHGVTRPLRRIFRSRPARPAVHR
ncbi:MAG TPA: phage holin family protein, partial [Candidatus Thermoplasmatota archaeon]|nr:phage holin family protein [Candidatus Thermoplasmatota archaeon]